MLVVGWWPLEPERFQGFCKGIAALVADLEALVEKRKV